MEDLQLAREVRQSFERFRFGRSVEDVTHPRRPGRVVRRPVAIAITAVAAVAVWAFAATPFAGTPQPAFAGWAAVPTTSDAALAAAAQSTCLSDASLPPMSLVAQDQRGNAATLLYAGGGELSICLVLRDAKGAIVNAASGVSHLEGGGNGLSVDTGLSAPPGQSFAGLRIVAGRTGPAVSSVKVARADGVTVDATVRSGYFVAWWPTADRALTVSARDASGRILQTVTGPS